MKKLRSLALAGVFVLISVVRVHAFDENFATDPAARGWFATGNTNLFYWDATNQNVHATWDSRETNSYFTCPLGTTLTRTNDFCLVFDLKLDDFTPNIDPAMTNAPFQLSIGLINLAAATAPGFHRASGYECPDIADFSFLPDSGGSWTYGSSLSSVLVDDTGYDWDYTAIKLGFTTGAVYRVTLTFDSSEGLLRTAILCNGQPYATLPPGPFSAAFDNYAIDHVAICSYNEANQYAGYEGSLLAHGTVDNLSFIPTLPVKNLTPVSVPVGHAFRCDTQTNWLYSLQRAAALQSWTPVTVALAGTGAALTLTDTNPPAAATAYYRIVAAKP